MIVWDRIVMVVLCYMPWPLNPGSVICLACGVATLHTTTLALANVN